MKIIIIIMADKRGFVCWKRGLFNSNTWPSHTNKKLQEIYFEAARHRWVVQKIWKRIRDNPTHYWSMWATRAPTKYVKRHDGLSKIIHQKLAEAAELIDDESPYYKYTPASVLENENSILMDKTIPFKWPDITFMNKKTKNTFLIDIAVPNTYNLAKTITDKQNKYQELTNEIFAMWKQKAAQVIPIVISPMGVIPKSLSQSLTRLNLHPNTHIQLQKSVILGTCSIVRNFLNYEYDHRA
jgi:hypothetical protein